MSTTKISLDLAPDWYEGTSLPRVIPTGVHGALDHAVSAFNLLAPSLLGLKDSPAASSIPRLNGAAIPMPLHLALDAAKGALLASSPWLFGFANKGTRYRPPHAAVGTIDLLGALISKKEPS